MAVATAPLITCLTCTHGRFQHLREAITCFLWQDYPNKELIILNNHIIPLKCNLPNIKIINEMGYPNLGACRNRVLKEAKGEYVNIWDDDDWWLPFHLSQCYRNIGEGEAFKPLVSWFNNAGKFILQSNVFEASVLIRTDILKKYGYKESEGDEHEPWMKAITPTCILKPVEPSYIYNWGNGLIHASGKLGSMPLQEQVKDWMMSNNDFGNEESLTPVEGLLERIQKGIQDAKDRDIVITRV